MKIADISATHPAALSIMKIEIWEGLDLRAYCSSAKSAGIDLKDVLSYELASVPLSLANLDGTLRKTPKRSTERTRD